MGFDFEKLIVYKKSLEFADKIYKVTRTFPREEQFGITSQLRRASLSISLNIAEGYGRKSNNERRQFLNIARGSVNECIPLIDISHRQKLIELDLKNELYLNCSEISRMICGLINTLK